MNMVSKLINETVDTTAVSMTATSSATMIGFSVAIITLIITLVTEPRMFPNMVYVLIFYILAIFFFIFATEFFILSAWNKENHIIWGTIGSVTYGLGLGWIILGISLTFDIFHFTGLAYLTITLFLFGFIIYYSLRWKIKKEEPYTQIRVVARSLMMIQLFIGYIALYVLN